MFMDLWIYFCIHTVTIHHLRVCLFYKMPVNVDYYFVFVFFFIFYYIFNLFVFY